MIERIFDIHRRPVRFLRILPFLALFAGWPLMTLHYVLGPASVGDIDAAGVVFLALNIASSFYALYEIARDTPSPIRNASVEQSRTIG